MKRPAGVRLAELLVRRRALIAALWALGAAALLPLAGRLPARLDPGARLDGSESAEVERLMKGPLASSYARFAVLVIGGAPSPATPAGAALLRRVVTAVRATPGVAAVFSHLDFADSLWLGVAGEGTWVLVGLADSAGPDPTIRALRGVTTLLAAEHPRLTLRWTGQDALNLDLRAGSTADVSRAERRALPLTLALLLFAFGALVAAVVPVLMALLAVAVTLGAAAVFAGWWPLSLLLQSIVPMLGLGLGIDYALLMVSRFREALAAGAVPHEAAAVAGRHAGHTILLSAATVALAFLALLTVPLNEMRAIAVGGLLVVVISALLATTLLPGLLATLGSRIDWLSVRRSRSPRMSADRWTRWGRWVTGHPWTALLLGGVPLLVLAAHALTMRTGLPSGDWLPAGLESAQALRELRAMGRGGVIEGLRLVVELPEGGSFRGAAAWRALDDYGAALAADLRAARVRSLVTTAADAGLTREEYLRLPGALSRRLGRGLVSDDARLALVEVLPREGLTAEALSDWVRELRAAGAPPDLAGATLRIGGLPAFNADYQAAVSGRFGVIAALVVGGTLVALTIGFRSLLVPLKAVALNLLSVAAAFGVLTLVFQQGHGAALLGVREPLVAVFSSLPVIVFAIVFGLSMDYEVFLMTRVMEARRGGAADRDAIVGALATTGRVITNAALIMLAVFGAFTLGDVLMTKMLGFALAVAVLLDATVVRVVIGPALLQLAGRWNWWPGTLAGPPRSPAGAGDATA